MSYKIVKTRSNCSETVANGLINYDDACQRAMQLESEYNENGENVIHNGTYSTSFLVVEE